MTVVVNKPTTTRRPRQLIARSDGTIFRSHRYPPSAEQIAQHGLFSIDGVKVAAARLYEEMGQRAFAEALEMSQTDVRDIEHGGCYADIAFLCKLANVFYTPRVWEFFRG